MSSSSADANKFAQFVDSVCQCSNNGRSRVRIVRWIRVPMAISLLYGVTQLLRLVLAIPSAGKSVSKTKDLSHECIEICFICDVCGNDTRWVCEFSPKGKFIVQGYYRIELRNERSFQPSRLDLDGLKSCFLSATSVSSRPYNLVSNNCGHFSRELYSVLSSLG